MEPIKVTVGGDLCLANDPQTVGFGLVNKLLKEEKKFIAALSKYFGGSDLSLVNLESPISKSNSDALKNSFLSPPVISQILLSSGINCVNVANNHILEHGCEIFNNTIQALSGNGIEVIGTERENISSIVYKNIKDRRIGIAGFNNIHDYTSPGTYAKYSRVNVLNSIDQMISTKTELIIVVLHWGNEYVQAPSLEQIIDARAFIDAGAHLIIGHHPHVLQPVERYKKGLIIYSLGNLYFDFLFSRAYKTSMIIDIFFDSDISYNINYFKLDEKEIFLPLLESERNRIQQIVNNSSPHIINEKDYKSKYYRSLRLKRFSSRLMMKKQLLILILKRPTKLKFIISNLINHYNSRKHKNAE